MISMEQLNGEIAALEEERPPFVTMEKLASLYTVRDHMMLGSKTTQPVQIASTEIIDIQDGDSEFLKAINGKSVNEVLPVIDELMETIKVLNERLYDGVMRKLL